MPKKELFATEEEPMSGERGCDEHIEDLIVELREKLVAHYSTEAKDNDLKSIHRVQ